MKYYKYIIISLGVLILALIGYIIYMRTTISPLDNNVDTDNNIINNSSNKELNYDCTFTKTFRFIQKIDYETYVEGTSYILGDTYQSYQPVLLIIDNKALDKMDKNKYYEFTYTLKGKMRESEMNDLNDINMLVKTTYDREHSIGSNKAYLEVKDTNKIGLKQIQESICKGK